MRRFSTWAPMWEFMFPRIQERSWEVLGDLPCTYVHDLAIHPRENMIIVATHGRGMFVLDADPVNTAGEDRKRG